MLSWGPWWRYRYLLATGVLAAPLAELGHALAYLVRYGSQGMAVQSDGVHGYFPTALYLAAGCLGGAGLAALLVVALARLLLGRALGLGRSTGATLLPLLSVAVAVQMDVYVAQETIETLVGGQPYTLGVLASILGWGLAGQIPISLLAALVVRWLSVRFEAAITGLRGLWHRCVVVIGRVPLAAARRVQPAPSGHVLALAAVAPRALEKRGPPDRPLI